WSPVAVQAVYRGESRRMAASACRSPADKGAPTGPEGYRGITEGGVGADAVRREPAPEAGARSGVERNGVHAVRALTDRVVSGRRELAARLTARARGGGAWGRARSNCTFAANGWSVGHALSV